MSAPAPSPTRPARPALADRDCSNVNMAPTRSSTMTVSRARNNKDSYASVAASPSSQNHSNNHGNNHNHNNNGNNNMARRRSYHNNRSHSQAAQDGYFMRKAAKAIAERRKAAAVAAATSNGNSKSTPQSGATTAAPTAKTPVSPAAPTAPTNSTDTPATTPTADQTPAVTSPATPSADTTAPPSTTPLTPSAADNTVSTTTPATPSNNNDPPPADGLPQRASVPVINVTVDPTGSVRIRDGPSPSPSRSTPRRGSQHRIARSVSRGRGVDDKENCSVAGNESFSRRRGSKRDLGRRSSKDFGANGPNGSGGGGGGGGGNNNGQGEGATLQKSRSGVMIDGENTTTKDGEGSWDGSMPRRQSSRGLIERNARVENRAKRTPVEQDSSDCVLQRSLSRQSVHDNESVRTPKKQQHSKRRTNNNNVNSFATLATHANVPGSAECSGSEDGGRPEFDFRRVQSQIAVSNDLLNLNLDVAPRGAGQSPPAQIVPSVSVNMAKVDIPPKPSVRPTLSIATPTKVNIDVDSTAAALEKATITTATTTTTNARKTSTTVASETSEVLSQASETSEARSSSTSDSQKMPQCGKWCDECAGLGMTIAAMLADMEGRRPSTAGPADFPTKRRLSTTKKTWRSVVSHTVLGSGESKTASERTRLMQENTVLRTTVEFLYRKVAQLEQDPSSSAGSGTPGLPLPPQ